MTQIFKDNYDPATQQITLSLVAIHTTSDLLQQTMVDLAQHPDLFEPLREELVRVLGTEGLKKSALNNLKLMDSVLKESQRLKPALLCTWRRLATENIELSSGFDDEWYDNPEQYDGYRFLRMRNTDEEKHAHLVSASPKHTAFGYGQHACPGRFFAANELKIAVAHLLLKYDWKLADETRNPTPVPFGMALLPDPNVKFLIRRRKEEIDLNSLEC
ncbi:Cytochrome P450 monooxygenase [Colletotrichum sp. SAR11_57]|nr:Cytochrome P450 monooxygenase [Colletotrichum sp. SAR11_57]